MKMDKSSLVSPNTDFAVVASVLQQQQHQPHPQPPTDPPSAINSPGNIKTYARATLPGALSSAPNYAIHDQASSGAMLEAPTAMMAAAAAAAAATTTATTKILVSSSSTASSDLVDGHSDACSEDSRHSVSSLDSGKGSTTVPSTSVSPESHPTSSSSHPSVHNVSHHGGAGDGATSSAGNAPGSVVKFESTLVKKMLAGVVNLNGGETKEADPTSVSSALTTVANGVANGHPVIGDKDKNIGVRDVPHLQQHAAQTVSTLHILGFSVRALTTSALSFLIASSLSLCRYVCLFQSIFIHVSLSFSFALVPSRSLSRFPLFFHTISLMLVTPRPPPLCHFPLHRYLRTACD